MAKRSTSGMPRKQREADRKQYLSKAEKEVRAQRYLLIAAGIAISAVVVVLIYALINDFLIVPEQEISTVNGQEIKTKDFQERVKAERWRIGNEIRESYEIVGSLNNQFIQNQLNQLANPEAIGSQVLDDMELQILLEEEAKVRGVEVDEGKIQAQVDNYLQQFTGRSLTPTPTEEPTEITTATATPLITAVPSSTPTASSTPTETPAPTQENCTEGDCPTVTPLPTSTTTPTATATPDNTATPTNTPLASGDIEATVERFESSFYNQGDESADIDRDTIRDYFYFVALRDAMRESVTDEMIENGELDDQRWSANARHILIQVPGTDAPDAPTFDPAVQCGSEEWQPYRAQAEAVLTQLNNGEPFATLAIAISDDTGSGANGGMLGEVDDVKTSYVPEFAQAIIDGDMGAYLGPVCTQFGFHIIQVLDKELSDIPEFELDQLRNEAYQTWESDLLIRANIQRRSDWQERVPDDPSVDDLVGDLLEEDN